MALLLPLAYWVMQMLLLPQLFLTLLRQLLPAVLLAAPAVVILLVLGWCHVNSLYIVKIVDGGLYFSSCILFYFILFIFLLFSIFRTTWVRVDRSCHHISHNLMAKSQDWSWDIGERSRRFWNKVTSYNMDNTCWPHIIHIVFRVGCTVVSTDHE